LRGNFAGVLPHLFASVALLLTPGFISARGTLAAGLFCAFEAIKES
jgi:hypothetical protein